LLEPNQRCKINNFVELALTKQHVTSLGGADILTFSNYGAPPLHFWYHQKALNEVNVHACYIAIFGPMEQKKTGNFRMPFLSKNAFKVNLTRSTRTLNGP
jgi:hypothetical protein